MRVLRDDAARWCVVSEQPAPGPVARWELHVDTVDGIYRATSHPPRWMLLSEAELREVVREIVRISDPLPGIAR